MDSIDWENTWILLELLRLWAPTHLVTHDCLNHRDFDAPCETRRLRAQKRRTPWPGNEQLHSIPFPQDDSERPQSFCFRRASGIGRWGRRQQCSSRQRVGAHVCAQSAGAYAPFEIARCLSQKWRGKSSQGSSTRPRTHERQRQMGQAAAVQQQAACWRARLRTERGRACAL